MVAAAGHGGPAKNSTVVLCTNGQTRPIIRLSIKREVKTMKAGDTYTDVYGIIEIGEPHYLERESYSRIDYFTPYNTDTKYREECHLAGPADFSPHYLADPDKDYSNKGYDSRCSCCYFGHCHSEAAHRKNIEFAKWMAQGKTYVDWLRAKESC
jgi:hypothetical protein